MRAGGFADRAFDRKADLLNAADRRLAQELSYGVLRLQGRLDWILEPLVRGGLKALHPEVLDILRLGAYQLLELDRIPAYAAVSEAVSAARDVAGEGAARLTNAVLRRLGREGGRARLPNKEKDPLGYLAGWGSHPAWLVERWLRRWQLEEVEQLLDYNNRRPPVYLRVFGRLDIELERLRAAGFEAEPAENSQSLGKNSLRIDAGRVIEALQLIRAVVQDPAASAVVDYVVQDLDTSATIVDLCAAPGGKAAVLAGLGYEVLAFDVARSRLPMMVANRQRLGLERLHLGLADSTAAPVSEARAVLLDVPCSGTGTLARNPDARWRLRPGDLEELVSVQSRLLDAAAAAIRPDGWLVYATCSLEPEENEEQVLDFLARHGDFTLDPPQGLPDEWLGDDGALRLTPQRHGVDGVYAARFRRRTG